MLFYFLRNNIALMFWYFLTCDNQVLIINDRKPFIILIKTPAVLFNKWFNSIMFNWNINVSFLVFLNPCDEILLISWSWISICNPNKNVFQSSHWNQCRRLNNWFNYKKCLSAVFKTHLHDIQSFFRTAFIILHHIPTSSNSCLFLLFIWPIHKFPP